MIYTVTFNPAIDYVVRLDRELRVGDVNRARGEDCVLGGKGINVSGVLAQLGCESVALGFVAGETGAWLERGLAAQGLKTDFVRLAKGMTRINVKIKAGQETELNGAGPDIPEDAMRALEEKLDRLQQDDILVLAGSIPASLAQTTYERILARLEGRGVRAVVDATRDLLVNVLRYRPFLIKPNNHELSEITGVKLTTDREIAAAAKMMQDKGARNVLVSMAGDGALLLDEQGGVHLGLRHALGHGGRRVAGGDGVDAQTVDGPGRGDTADPAGQGVLAGAVGRGALVGGNVLGEVQDPVLLHDVGDHIDPVGADGLVRDGVGGRHDAAAAFFNEQVADALGHLDGGEEIQRDDHLRRADRANAGVADDAVEALGKFLVNGLQCSLAAFLL